MRTNKSKINGQNIESRLAEGKGPEKINVECICPKCGTVHKMKFLWTGRGTPRKYCLLCKNFVTVVESVDYHSIPSNI